MAERRKKQQGNNAGCLIYSVGSNGDYSFEDGLVDLIGPTACEIHTFDPDNYARATSERTKNMYYHQWGIKNSHSYDFTKEARKEKFLSMQETVKELGHENRVIDILKIDCEGCEWASYNDWLKLDIHQILVETHGAPSNAHGFFDGLLKAGYVIFSKEPNIEPGALSLGGLNVEFSFIKLHPDFSKPMGTTIL